MILLSDEASHARIVMHAFIQSVGNLGFSSLIVGTRESIRWLISSLVECGVEGNNAKITELASAEAHSNTMEGCVGLWCASSVKVVWLIPARASLRYPHSAVHSRGVVPSLGSDQKLLHTA